MPKLVLALVHLVATPKQIGYLSALRKTWAVHDLELDDMPAKSSLSEARNEVSFEFFKDALSEQTQQVQPCLPRFRGFSIHAVDGDQLELPATESILSAGYRGHLCKDNQETHYPRMYYTTRTEVFSGVVVDVKESTRNEECKHAVEMAKTASTDSISLYDRLHFSIKLAQTHEQSKSFYVARLKQGEKVLLELQDFIRTGRKAKRICIDGIFIRFLKVKNPKTKEHMYLATNLSRGSFKIREIQWLYWRRYDTETVFRDLTSTHSLGIWHSTKINGILQEFYLQFYVHNASRWLILSQGGIEVIKDLKTGEYRRPNFKLIREYFIDNLKLLVHRQIDQFRNDIQILIKKSTELRVYFSRISPRQVKYTRNTYKSASLIPRRA